MHQELKKYSSIGNLRGIKLLCHTVLSRHQISFDAVRNSCAFVNGCTINFNCGFLALQELQVVQVENEKFIINNPFFADINEEAAFVILCEKVFTYLIDENLINIELLKFNDQVELFYIPKRAFSLHSAVFRNLLITLNALVAAGSEYRIPKEYDKFFGRLIKSANKRLTLEQLKKKLDEETELGEKGELFVLDFERNRCKYLEPDLQRIRQISHIDVTAGYDIISFHDAVSLKRRYIEVKTYRGKPHFYWSANEIESARLRGADYCIYLVDADKIYRDGYRPEIIINPFNEINNNSNLWKMTPSSFLVEKLSI